MTASTKPRYLLVRATPTTYVFMNLHGYGIGQERYAISRAEFWGRDRWAMPVELTPAPPR